MVGAESTGKTTSLRTLDPKVTSIVNTLNKPLPIRGYKKLYNAANKNLLCTDNYAKIIQYIQFVDKKALHIKNLVLDDAIFVMLNEYMQRASEAGFTKFSELAAHLAKIVETARSCREDLNIIFMWHKEDVVSDGVITGYKIKVAGKLIEDKQNLAAMFTTVLYTHVEQNKKDNTVDYQFVTNRYKKYPAKSPMDCFEDILIPNDMQLVIDTLNEYYE